MSGSSDFYMLSKVFTGRHPFSEFSALATISKIIAGERPDHPQELSLTDGVWDMTLRCWDEDPVKRPTMIRVVGILREWLVSFLLTEPTS